MHQKNMRLLSDNWENINKKVIEPLWRHKFESKYLAVKLDKDDFLSLAGEELTKAFKTYDEGASNLYTYATNVLTRKAKTEIRNMKRQKRLCDLCAESISQQVNSENKSKIEDMLEDIGCIEEKEGVEIELVLSEIYLLLKPKEKRIVELSMRGLSNSDIANILHNDTKTVNEIRKSFVDRSDIKRVLRRHGYLGGIDDEI